MTGFLLDAARRYWLTPWRSPYLKWRIETYWGTHAEQIGFREFWAFVWQRKWDLIRFLRWASRMRLRTS
jgi:hypothetical protein